MLVLEFEVVDLFLEKGVVVLEVDEFVSLDGEGLVEAVDLLS